MTPRPRGLGRRGGPLVDEPALIRRYTRDKWTLAECGRRFGITAWQARAILLHNDVEPRPARRAPLDEDAVLRAYRKHLSVYYVATAMSTDCANVAAVLDRHGVPHSARTRPPEYDTSSRSRLARARQARPATEPSPADLLLPFQAARMLNVTTDVLRAAGEAGQIQEARNAAGHRRYARRDVEDLAQRLNRSAGKTGHASHREPATAEGAPRP